MYLLAFAMGGYIHTVCPDKLLVRRDWWQGLTLTVELHTPMVKFLPIMDWMVFNSSMVMLDWFLHMVPPIIV